MVQSQPWGNGCKTLSGKKSSSQDSWNWIPVRGLTAQPVHFAGEKITNTKEGLLRSDVC
jgi:hypothetical protein